MRRTMLGMLTMLALIAGAAPADAGCGCDKPPPPLAAVRPFVGFVDSKVTLFDARLVPGQRYNVQFIPRSNGGGDWSRGKAKSVRDFTDGQYRNALRVSVPDIAYGPSAIEVYDDSGNRLYRLTDDRFTVTSEPVPLHEFGETVSRDGYQAGIGSDGTLYVAVDVKEVTDATTFTGAANGLPLTFTPQSVAMYNMQGFLMQLLDPTVPGLFQLQPGIALQTSKILGLVPVVNSVLTNVPSGFVSTLIAPTSSSGGSSSSTAQTSDVLSYWRHEFGTYKEQHRQQDAFQTDADPDWHADGSPHVDHNTIVVAISGKLTDGSLPRPGATPPFRLVISSSQVALQ